MLALYTGLWQTTSTLLSIWKTNWEQHLVWITASEGATGWQEAVEKGSTGVRLWQWVAGWVSPGTIPPVSAYLKSFAWLIRDDRTAAPNLQSAVTRGQCRRQSMGGRTLYKPAHKSATCVDVQQRALVLYWKSDTSHSFQPGSRQEMMWCWI